MTQRRRSAPSVRMSAFVEQGALSAWEAEVLPLNYNRLASVSLAASPKYSRYSTEKRPRCVKPLASAIWPTLCCEGSPARRACCAALKRRALMYSWGVTWKYLEDVFLRVPCDVASRSVAEAHSLLAPLRLSRHQAKKPA